MKKIIMIFITSMLVASCADNLTFTPKEDMFPEAKVGRLSLIHISEPTRRHHVSRMPSSA